MDANPFPRTGPDHLKDIIKPIHSLDFPHKVWFERCDFKGKVIINGNENLNILFNGQIIENSLVNIDDRPLVIYVRSDEVNRVIFDSSKHGYQALLIERTSWKETLPLTLFKDAEGEILFQIYLWANFSIDFDEEFFEGTYRDYLKNNAFDSFGIIIKNRYGNYYSILEMELC